MSSDAPGATRQHPVRPRPLWAGVVITIVGGAVIAAGLIVSTTLLWVIGLVLVAIGALLCLRGGILYDATAHSTIGNEMHHVVRGGELPGVAAGEMVDPPRSEAIAAFDDARKARLEAQVPGPLASPLMAPPAGMVMLLLAVIVLGSEWSLGAESNSGMVTSYFDTGVAVVLGLAGMRCAFSPGSHRLAAAFAVLAGVVLLLESAFVKDQELALEIARWGSGAVAILAGAVAFVAGHLAARQRAASAAS